MAKHTPGPWRWMGEDYRGGWGWQMLVGPSGEGLIVGAGRDGGPSDLIRAGQPLDPALCVTGFEAHGRERADCVHVFGVANARLIAAAPDLLEALRGLLSHLGPEGYIPGAGEPATRRAQAALAKAEGKP